MTGFRKGDDGGKMEEVRPKITGKKEKVLQPSGTTAAKAVEGGGENRPNVRRERGDSNKWGKKKKKSGREK